MATQPKSSAEILAAAKRVTKKQTKPQKPRTEPNLPFKNQLSTIKFSPEPNTLSTAIPELISSGWPRKSDIDSTRNIAFEALEAAVEIEDVRMDVDQEDTEDLFNDKPLQYTWVMSFTSYLCNIFHIFSEISCSEPDSPVDNLSNSQMGLSLLQCIQDALALLCGRRLSPFDLILEVLDENKPQYSYHRTEFYKDGNEKLECYSCKQLWEKEASNMDTTIHNNRPTL